METPGEAKIQPALPASRAWGAVAAWAAWCALAAGIGWRFGGAATDDIFITYRYAYNLATGHGFVFNPGERVFGVTDPGVGLLLAAMHVVTGAPVPWLGSALTAGSLVAIAGLMLAECKQRGRLGEGLAGGTLVVSSAYLWTGQGAGPIPALALLLGAARLARPAGAAARGGPPADLLAGLCAGAAVWCRPDAAIGVGLLALLLWRERRRLPLTFAAAAGLVMLAGAAAALAWFGTAIPNTLSAKRQYAALNPALLTGVAVFWGNALDLFRLFAGPGAGAMLLLGLAGQPALLFRAGRAGRLLVLHALALAVAYTLLRVPFFIWYTVPAAVAVLYGAAFLAGAVWRAAVRGGNGRIAVSRRQSEGAPRGASRGWADAWPVAVKALLALLLLVLGASWAWGGVSWWRYAGAGDWRRVAYPRAGVWIREHSAPAEDIAFDEVGMLAYWSERPLQDLIGLVSPRSLPYAAVGDFTGAFLAKPTTFVVFHTFDRYGGTRHLVIRPWFAAAYREVERIEMPRLGGGIAIYRRLSGVPLPPPRPPHRRRAGPAAPPAPAPLPPPPSPR
jgi:hypothetical protein